MMPIDRKQLRSGNLNGTYRDFAEVLGMEITLRIFQYYKGLQVTFPTRLLDKAFVEEQIRKEYNGTNAKDLARKYEYSERWIRKILNLTKK